MRQKTFKLSESYALSEEGKLLVMTYTGRSDEPWNSYEWIESKIQVGEKMVLVSSEDVGPGSKSKERYYLIADKGGVSGNMDRDIKRYHGWRGTTNNSSVYAHGLREVIKISERKNGDIYVTVGKDLKPELA